MVPIIDFNSSTVEKQMEEAYTTCGFAVFTNVYDSWLSEFSDWQQLMEEFFKQKNEIKIKYSYSGVEDNIGFSRFEEERLTPNKPGDLKESFNWVSPDRMKEQFWPTEIPEFKPLAQKILRIAQLLSLDFLYKFENILSLPKGSLVEQHIDAASTIRIIKYPMHNDEIIQGQLRGNEHTDYGSITLLWRFDDVSGLQVFDREKDGWFDVPIVENSIVLNIGDMFQRWSNDKFKSTPHRVVNADLNRTRYSMPYFVDAGRDVIISNLTNEADKYPPISAYAYLKWRLAQSYNDQSYVQNEEVNNEGAQHLPNY
jgi:isopenicillin N synthase-like dioxygenase